MIIEIAGEKFDVVYTENPHQIDMALHQDKPKFFTYDTETTGLHLKKDRPCLGAICYDNKVWVFPTTKEILSWLPEWARKIKGRVYGHNVGYDMHMTANIVGDKLPTKIRWGDTMGMCRLVFEAISVRDGGDSLALKNIAVKHIDKDANKYEKGVQAWLQAKSAQNRKILMALLKGYSDAKGKWSLTRMEKARKNKESIPHEVIDIYNSWNQEYPEPTYADVPLDILMPYLAVDVILTKMIVLKTMPIIIQRKQVDIMNTEFDLIPVVYKMERRGIKVDREYLQDCAIKVDEYIEDLYIRLHELAGVQFSVNQHAKVKEIINGMIGEKVLQSKESYSDDPEVKKIADALSGGKTPINTDKAGLKKLGKFTNDVVVLEIAEITGRLRRLEKWRSTYIQKILDDSEHDGRFYTQMSQFNPVSGRFSGDAQQFPKDPIYTADGYAFEKANPDSTVPEEYVLYHPRKAFLGYMYYLDYSQVELRVQGHYTLYFGGDDNLLRAYMPYKCHHFQTGESYDYKTVEGRNRWSELREGAPSDLHWEKALEKGWSVWINDDTGEVWKPTDVHMATTLKALIAMGLNPDEMDKDLVKWWRKKGKTFNFMRNYGGGDQKASETLDISLDQAKAMNQGYTDAFPVVVTYQNEVIKKGRELGYVENLCGRRYYLSDWNKLYKLANYLIQGSCADELKRKMIVIDQYLEENDLWEKLPMILCVHDELQFENIDRDPAMAKHIAKIKAIMEDTPDILVPIVAEAEVTETDWSEKVGLLVA